MQRELGGVLGGVGWVGRRIDGRAESGSDCIQAFKCGYGNKDGGKGRAGQ